MRIPLVSHKQAKTPPPAALNGSPNDDTEEETMEHPLPPIAQSQYQQWRVLCRLSVYDGWFPSCGKEHEVGTDLSKNHTLDSKHEEMVSIHMSQRRWIYCDATSKQTSCLVQFTAWDGMTVR